MDRICSTMQYYLIGNGFICHHDDNPKHIANTIKACLDRGMSFLARIRHSVHTFMVLI